MTFEEFDAKLFDLVAEAIRDETVISAVVGALASQARRMDMLWAIDLGREYYRHVQQEQQDTKP